MGEGQKRNHGWNNFLYNASMEKGSWLLFGWILVLATIGLGVYQALAPANFLTCWTPFGASYRDMQYHDNHPELQNVKSFGLVVMAAVASGAVAVWCFFKAYGIDIRDTETGGGLSPFSGERDFYDED